MESLVRLLLPSLSFQLLVQRVQQQLRQPGLSFQLERLLRLAPLPALWPQTEELRVSRVQLPGEPGAKPVQGQQPEGLRK